MAAGLVALLDALLGSAILVDRKQLTVAAIKPAQELFGEFFLVTI
jgi:hypothetical protein